MGASIWDGPLFAYGDLGTLKSSPGGTALLTDPNPDRGPSVFFQGMGVPDTRYTFLKDLVQGYAGRIPALLVPNQCLSVNAIPALHATNLLVTSANAVAGTSFTLVATAAYGRTPGIPIVPFTGTLGGSAPITVTALDFGFCYGTTTTGATAQTVTVLDSTIFAVGQPLVISSAGASSGALTPLLCWVTALPTATTITISAPALQAGSFAIGSGNLWSPSEFGQLTPTAHMPVVASGPGLFLDARQSIARGLVCVASNALGTGGNVVVKGYDIYGQAMSESIAITPASALTAYGKKAFKFIVSATPDFTDATYLYTLGTSDVFGLHQRADYLEDLLVYWDSALVLGTAGTAANFGFVAADTTNPATSTRGDVRGTIQPSSVGGTTGPALGASSGSVSTITITGRRLAVRTWQSPFDQLQNRISHPEYGFGVVQA